MLGWYGLFFLGGHGGESRAGHGLQIEDLYGQEKVNPCFASVLFSLQIEDLYGGQKEGGFMRFKK